MRNWLHTRNETLPDNPTIFKDCMFMNVHEFPDSCFPIDYVLEVVPNVTVKTTKFFRSRQGETSEGRILSGYSLMVTACVEERIVYATNDAVNSVHITQFSYLKGLSVMLPESIDGVSMESRYVLGKLIVQPYVEDVETRILSSHVLQSCVMLCVSINVV